MNIIPKLMTFILVVIAICVYYPSLSGGFLYDDFWTLAKLEEISGSLTFENIFSYLMSADTGPLKRPIAMLSFLIDARDWPAEPLSFKITNLVIHAINGVLLFILIYEVFKRNDSLNKQATLMAFFSALLWVCHPFLVSTVAYVVQRMAMLPVFFSLLSLLLYLRFRVKYQNIDGVKSLLILFLLVYGFAFLGALSKENGLLILLYIPLFEYFICRQFLALRRMDKFIELSFLYFPVLLLIIALIIKLPGALYDYSFREFTLLERLMSQPRALVEYLLHWIIPSVNTAGIYGDTFVVSESLLEPISTVLSMFVIAALIIGSILFRTRWPVIGFCILFFFASHLIESTVFPLQLYFEHRNYSAFLFLAVIIVYILYQYMKPLMATVLLSLVSIFVFYQGQSRAQLWGDQIQLKTSSLVSFPHSNRARIAVVELLDNKINYKKGIEIVNNGLIYKQSPDLIAVKLILICKYENIQASDIAELEKSIQIQGLSLRDLYPISNLVQNLLNDNCQSSVSKIDRVKDILAIVQRYLNPNKPMGWAMFYYARGRVALVEKQYELALDSFIQSFERSGEYPQAIMAVSQFLSNGQPEYAMKLLDVISKRSEKKFGVSDKIVKEIGRFKKITLEDIHANK